MALKIQCWWRRSVAVNEVAKRRQADRQAKIEVNKARIIQATWRGYNGRNDAASWQSERNSRQEEFDLAASQMCRQPTLVELQLLSQTGRFSNLSDDSDGDSEFEDAPSFVGEVPFALASMQSQELLDNERESSPRLSHSDFGARISTGSVNMAPEFSISSMHSQEFLDNGRNLSPRLIRGDFETRVSTGSVNMAPEFSIPEYNSAFNDDRSDASSDIFVDAMEETKLIEHNLYNSSADEDRHRMEESNSSAPDLATDTSVCEPGTFPPSPIMEESLEKAGSERPSSSISDFDRPSSVRSGSFIQDMSFDSDKPRGSLASSSLSGISQTRDESSADPFRSREDSYADLTRDSYADSIRSHNDSFADVSCDKSPADPFRSREDSYADLTRDSYADSIRSHNDSFADVSCDESSADPFRSREDSYADSTRDSYADSTRSRNDSYADVSRPRDDSYADVFRSSDNNSYNGETRSCRDSYDDVPYKSGNDEANLSDAENREGLKYFDSESDRESSFISDYPVTGHNTNEIEKNEAHEEEEAVHKKNGSRWRGASVLSALSSRHSSKPTSSPASSFEDEEKDETKGRMSVMPSVSSLSSVATMLTRKLSVPMSNSTSTKSSEAETEESIVVSPLAQQVPKTKSRFGRFAAPSVSKSSFPTRFAWKS
ncbi:hypothetical protein DD237_003837 [Peronospora effusa]|uniref:Uncharacterized protein n=1 Tax=Peronospora effusa TaxID=542832 RepID=A0A425C8H4_9STRA|nr:hypothetical protein DD237_003837 [Peronospora effusa]